MKLGSLLKQPLVVSESRFPGQEQQSASSTWKKEAKKHHVPQHAAVTFISLIYPALAKSTKFNENAFFFDFCLKVSVVELNIFSN